MNYITQHNCFPTYRDLMQGTKIILHKAVLQLNIVHFSRIILKIKVAIFFFCNLRQKSCKPMSSPVRQICFQVVRPCIFHPTIGSRVCQVSRFPPLLFVPGLSDLAFSTPAIRSLFVKSCVFHPAICFSFVRSCVFNHCDY